MLRFLRIQDFALIRELELEFGAGLNILTGETGSGKSILVDAMGLLTGDRSSPEMVRSRSDVAHIEGSFSIEPGGAAAAVLSEAGMETEDDSVLIRREISSSGRSRAVVNNVLVTLSFLRKLGEKLVDIHGQDSRQDLLDLSTHLGWLDLYGGLAGGVAEVRVRYEKMREVAARLESMQMDEQERLRRLDVLQFQIQEIRRVNPAPDEKDRLEQERRILLNSERIYSLAHELHTVLYECEDAVVARLNRLARNLTELESFDSSWTSQREALGDAAVRLEDIALAARDYARHVEFSPERLEETETRLAELDRLTRKYGSSIPEVLAYAARCETEFGRLEGHADTCRAAAQELAAETGQYAERAQRLSDHRRRAASKLARGLQKEFQALALGKMELQVFFQPRAESGSAPIPADYGPAGIDRVEFMIAPNSGEDFRPLARIASGGELSRIMLAIKTVCGQGDDVKTLVFDEVDAGIGGRVAEAVGRRLRGVAARNQVLCVTHLPQIAAFASRHYRVFKEAVAGDRTETFAACLEAGDRAEELARMLAGETITEITRRHAREMIAQAQEMKVES